MEDFKTGWFKCAENDATVTEKHGFYYGAYLGPNLSLIAIDLAEEEGNDLIYGSSGMMFPWDEDYVFLVKKQKLCLITC